MRGAGGHSRGLGNLALARLVAAAWVAGGGATALAEPGRAGDPPWLGPAFSAPAAALAEAAGRIPAPPNADLEVLLEEGRHVFAADGSARFAYRQVYRVLTPAGLSKGGVTRAVVHRVAVSHPGGSEEGVGERAVTGGDLRLGRVRGRGDDDVYGRRGDRGLHPGGGQRERRAVQ